VDGIGDRRLRVESALTFPEQAARFGPKPIEPRKIDEPFDCRKRSHPSWIKGP